MECCYQNTGIATSVAAAMFEGEELAVAVGVPLFYGICEAVFLAIYCITCWKLGWTKAPTDASLCTVIFTSYEVKELMESEPESIEVVLGGVEHGPSDLIFARTKEGYQIDEVSLESLTNVEDGEFTIDDDDEGDQEEAKVEVDMDDGSDLGSPNGELHHRTRRAYETVDLSSPVSQKRLATASLPPPLSDPLSNGGRSDAKSAVTGAISSLSSFSRGGKKYTMASSIGHDDTDDIPAAGKAID